jgi:hypothetical protein
MKNIENSAKMTITQFWNVIEASQTDSHSAKLDKDLAKILGKVNEARKQYLLEAKMRQAWDCSNMELRCYNLGLALRKLSAPEVKSFNEHFVDRLNELNTNLLHGACKILQANKLSNDEFHTYCTLVISCGALAFEEVLKSPLSLLRLHVELLGIGYNRFYGKIASHVYQEKTGKKLVDIKFSTKPSGPKLSKETHPEIFVNLSYSYEASKRQYKPKMSKKQQFLDHHRLDCYKTWNDMDLESYTPYKLPLEYTFIAPSFEVVQKLKDVFENDEWNFGETYVRDIPGNKTWRVDCTISKQLPEASDLADWVLNMHEVGKKLGCCAAGTWGFGKFDYVPVWTPERQQEFEEIEKNEPLICINA